MGEEHSGVQNIVKVSFKFRQRWRFLVRGRKDLLAHHLRQYFSFGSAGEESRGSTFVLRSRKERFAFAITKGSELKFLCGATY